MKRWLTALAIVAVELLAVIGALPLLEDRQRGFPCGFWEYNSITFPAFLMAVVGGTIFYTRHEITVVRVVAPIVIVGALMLTITAVQALA